ncbi:hypothetical protein WSM22_07110 [Cytophagales bacterium WSM2-2]|nr:hypothetical protein WSM22_07110 [Cytophagales bacterium WSM2-2]
MKLTLKVLLYILTASIVLSSCQLAHKSASIGVEDIKKSGFVMAKPLISDIEVDNQKIEGRAVISNKLYQASAGGARGAAMNLAVIDAVKKANCDIIVQPVYEIENSGTYTTATVRGFAGRYKNFREITAEDTAAFNVRAKLDRTSAVRERENNVQVDAGPVKGKSKVGALVGVILLIGLLGALPALTKD